MSADEYPLALSGPQRTRPKHTAPHPVRTAAERNNELLKCSHTFVSESTPEERSDEEWQAPLTTKRYSSYP